MNPRLKHLRQYGKLPKEQAETISRMIYSSNSDMRDLGFSMLNQLWEKYWGVDKKTRKYKGK